MQHLKLIFHCSLELSTLVSISKKFYHHRIQDKSCRTIDRYQNYKIQSITFFDFISFHNQSQKILLNFTDFHKSNLKFSQFIEMSLTHVHWLPSYKKLSMFSRAGRYCVHTCDCTTVHHCLVLRTYVQQQPACHRRLGWIKN